MQQQRIQAAPAAITGNGNAANDANRNNRRNNANRRNGGNAENTGAGGGNTGAGGGNTGATAPIISTANSTLGPPPATAYFRIDPGTDTISELPSAAGSNLAAGTDNATDAFVFPFSTEGLVFDNPAIPPNSSIGFPVGTTYENVVRNTNTGDRYRIRVTVNATDVSIRVEKL